MSRMTACHFRHSLRRVFSYNVPYRDDICILEKMPGFWANVFDIETFYFRVLHISTLYTLLSMLFLKSPINLHLKIYLLNNETWHNLIVQIALTIGENRRLLSRFHRKLFFRWQLQLYYAKYVSIKTSWCPSVSTNYRHYQLLLCVFSSNVIAFVSFLENVSIGV
jgi:hypothetical protein